MRATLLHNRKAGSVPGAYPKKQLLRLLRDAGFKVRYAPAKGKGLLEALADPGELIIIAGGDGTVSRVLRRLKRRDVPLALIPLGTANNIATSLGITGRPEGIIGNLPDAQTRRLDLAVARSARGEREFVESAGLGLFAEFLKQAEDGVDPGSRRVQLTQGLEVLRRLATQVRSRHCRVRADNEDLSGAYLMAMVLNICTVGPQVPLAPKAEPGDGKLDLLLVNESQRPALKHYLGGLGRGGSPPFPFPVRQVRRVRMDWVTRTGFADDRLWPRKKPAGRGLVTLEVAGAPFEVLVPRA